MPHYLVTGGYGFIGSNLVLLLRQKEPQARIAVLDKLTYAADPSHLDGVPCERVVGDFCDPKTVRACTADVVFHLAAETHVDRSIDDAAPFVRTKHARTDQTRLLRRLRAMVHDAELCAAFRPARNAVASDEQLRRLVDLHRDHRARRPAKERARPRRCEDERERPDRRRDPSHRGGSA